MAKIGNKEFASVGNNKENKLKIKSLEKSVKEMSLILNTMSELVVYQDLEHRIIYANKESAESVGVTPESLIGKYCYEIWGNGKDVCPNCSVDRALKTMKPETGYIKSSDGRYWLVKGYPVNDSNGNLVGAMEITLDVTKEQKLKKEIKENEKKYQFMVENISDIVFQQDKDLKITYVSPSVEKITGYTVEEIRNMNLLDLMTPESYKKGIENFRKYYEIVKRNPNFDVPTLEYEYYTKYGKKIVGEMKVKYISDEKGNIKGIHGVIRDITKRKELEKQLILSQKMEALGRLAGGVAHDFNNLLTVIMGYADIALMKENIEEKVKQYFREIKETSRKAADLVTRLLVFSKKQIVIPKLIDLNELIENNKKMLSRVIGEHIKLETELDKNLKKIKVDPTQIEQVIMNIVVNARDALPNGGIIKIRTKNEKLNGYDNEKYQDLEPGNYVIITISDNGTGMSEEIKRHIFEPFFTTKKDQKGTGLGLSTAFGIVKQNGGGIYVESTLGEGSTFEIFLPSYSGKIEYRNDFEENIEENVGGNDNVVLVVEDEKAVRNMILEILINNGYKVLCTGNGTGALKILGEKSIDFIISDVVMPGMDGKELFKNVKEKFPDLKFLFMSGYMENDPLLEDIKDDKVYFIKKPFSPDELLMKIKKILDSK